MHGWIHLDRSMVDIISSGSTGLCIKTSALQRLTNSFPLFLLIVATQQWPESLFTVIKTAPYILKGKDGITAGKCTENMGKPVCACDTDNCNHKCTALNCTKLGMGDDVPKEKWGTKECNANCKAPEGGSGNGDGAKTTGKADGTGQAATGDGSQTVAEPNKYALAFWILTVLVNRSF